MATTERLLRLLALLQSRPRWRAADLSGRLGVTPRTLRNDLARLRELGYEIRSTTGPDGGYALGQGAAMPPLLLDDEEAVAVAVGLRAAASGSLSGIEETSVRALAKLEQTMPSRLRQRVAALRSVTESAAARGPTVDTEVLTAIASAAERRERLRFDYAAHDGRTSRRDVEPYRLVYSGRRWYLVAWDTRPQDWRAFRADRITPHAPTGPRFPARDLPDEGAAAHVLRGVSTLGFPVSARIRLHVPAEEVADRIAPVGGRLTAVDDDACDLETAGPSLLEVAGYVAGLDVPFEILAPPELRDVVVAMAQRLADAARPRA